MCTVEEAYNEYLIMCGYDWLTATQAKNRFFSDNQRHLKLIAILGNFIELSEDSEKKVLIRLKRSEIFTGI